MDQVHLIAREIVDRRDFDERIASWLLLKYGTGGSHEDLTRQGRIIDTHIELEALVLRCTRDTLTDEVDAVSDIVESINALDLLNVCLIACEIRVGLDSGSDLIEIVTIQKFNIDHASVDTGSDRDCHGQSVLDTLDCLDSDGMSHAASRSEIGIGQAFRSHCLQESTDDGIGSRVPSSGKDGSDVILLCHGIEVGIHLIDARMNIEAIDGADAEAIASLA